MKLNREVRGEDRVGEAFAMRNLEESLPLLEEESLQRAAMSYKATTCEGCDGFHARVPLNLLTWWSFTKTSSSFGSGHNKLARRSFSDSEEYLQSLLPALMVGVAAGG